MSVKRAPASAAAEPAVAATVVVEKASPELSAMERLEHLEQELLHLNLAVPVVQQPSAPQRTSAPQRPSAPQQTSVPKRTPPTVPTEAQAIAFAALLRAHPQLSVALGHPSSASCLQAFSAGAVQYTARGQTNLLFLLGNPEFRLPPDLAFLVADIRDLQHSCLLFKQQAAISACQHPLGPDYCPWARAPQVCFFFWHFGRCPCSHAFGDLPPTHKPCLARMHLRPATFDTTPPIHWETTPLLVAIKSGVPPLLPEAPFATDVDASNAIAAYKANLALRVRTAAALQLRQDPTDIGHQNHYCTSVIKI